MILLLSGIGGIQSIINKRQTNFEPFRGLVHKIDSFLLNSGRLSLMLFITMYVKKNSLEVISPEDSPIQDKESGWEDSSGGLMIRPIINSFL